MASRGRGRGPTPTMIGSSPHVRANLSVLEGSVIFPDARTRSSRHAQNFEPEEVQEDMPPAPDVPRGRGRGPTPTMIGSSPSVRANLSVLEGSVILPDTRTRSSRHAQNFEPEGVQEDMPPASDVSRGRGRGRGRTTTMIGSSPSVRANLSILDESVILADARLSRYADNFEPEGVQEDMPPASDVPRGRGRGRTTTMIGSSPSVRANLSILDESVILADARISRYADNFEPEEVQEDLPADPDVPSLKKGRGKTRGLELSKYREAGKKIKIGFSRATGNPSADSDNELNMFTIELGVVVRNFAPLQAKSWEKIPDEKKKDLLDQMREKFEFSEETYVLLSILKAMGRRYSDYRSRLKSKYKLYPTIEEALAHRPDEIKADDWEYLYKLWLDSTYEAKCEINKSNKLKQDIHHAAGSRAFYKVQKALEIERGKEPDICETWKVTRYSRKRKGWVDEKSEIIYDKLCHRRDQGPEPLSDEQLSREVLGEKSGYIRGLGHGPKPSSSISGASSRERLMNELGEARRRATEAELNYEEARNQVIEAQKRTDELQERVQLLESQQAESIGTLSSQIAFLQK